MIVKSFAPATICTSRTIIEPEKSLPVVDEVDVIVAGGGIAGVFAALAAGQNGAKTILIERLGLLGGNYGPGLGVRDDLWQHPSIQAAGLGGIVGQFMDRLGAMGGMGQFAFTGGGDSNDWSWPGIHEFPTIDNEAFIYLALKMLGEVGVTVVVNTAVSGVTMDGNRLTGLVVENRSGRQVFMAQVVIDTTGEAEVAYHAGAPCTDAKKYGAGLFFQVEGVDWERFESFRSEGKDRPQSKEDEQFFEKVFIPALRGWRWPNYPRFMFPQIRQAWESGEYQYVQDIDGLCAAYMVPFGTHGQNVATVEGCPQGSVDPLDAKQMSLIQTRFRMYAYETVQFMRKYIPGFEKGGIRQIASFLGSRHSRRILAEHGIADDDILDNRQFDDVVHRLTTLHTETGSLVDLEHEQEGQAYELPFRQLLPQQIDGLMAAGRCINPGKKPRLRARWIVMLTGAIAGTAAAQAVKQEVTPKHLDVSALQKKLIEDGFSLGEPERLRELGLTDQA